MSERIVNVHEQDYGGKHFRSTLEAQTAKTLDAMGIPYQYEERKIELLEGFRTPFQKDKVRSVTYTPDFMIGSVMLECKGFETPEWRLKKKLLFKWLQENEPETIFYQIHDCRKSLVQALDNHWTYLGFAIQCTPQKKKKGIPFESKLFDSIAQAMDNLKLKGKALGPILNSLTGKKEFVYGYKWQLVKINALI